MDIRKFILYVLGIPKTMYFNFKYFPLKIAIKFPVFVSHRVYLRKCSGTISLSQVRRGIVKIGFGKVEVFDEQKSRSIWHVSGQVHFDGIAHIDHGSKIFVSGELRIGRDFIVTAESSIIAAEKITIGHGVLVSWDCLVMDTDFHKIYDKHEVQTNPPAPIIIGNKVWMGCRCLILKGACIADNIVIAAGTTVTKSNQPENSIIGGHPAKVLSDLVRWEI